MTTSLHKKYSQLLDGRAASMNDCVECKAWLGSSVHSVQPTHF